MVSWNLWAKMSERDKVNDSWIVMWSCQPQCLLCKIDYITDMIGVFISSCDCKWFKHFQKYHSLRSAPLKMCLAWTHTVCLNVILLKCWGHWPFAQMGLASLFNRGLRSLPSEWRRSHWAIASVSLLLRATWCHWMSDIKFDHNWWGEKFCCTHGTLLWIKWV